MTTTDHEGLTVTDLDLTSARAAIVRVEELLQDAADAGHTTVSIENVREMLTNLGPRELCPGMTVRLHAKVIDAISAGAVLELRNGVCVVVPTDSQATGAEILPWGES